VYLNRNSSARIPRSGRQRGVSTRRLVDAPAFASSPLVVAAAFVDIRATIADADADGADGWYRRVKVRAVRPATVARILVPRVQLELVPLVDS
jgi:hypothetical protein